MTRAARALIDLTALQANLAQVRRLAPHSKVLAVVKANGYGHGLARIAPALADADALAVAHLEEAMVLREAGITQPVVVLHGFNDEEELGLLKRLGAQPVVHSAHHLDLLEAQGMDHGLWLKVDTGMHRLGFTPEELHALWPRLEGHGPRVVMSHFANADRPELDANDEQKRLFAQTVAHLEGELSLANSAALMAYTDCHHHWVRPGVMLYGVNPFADGRELPVKLKPVMRLSSRLIAVKRLRQGEAVGYGHRWRAPQDTCLGVVGIGYGDGYPRHAADGTPVWLNGREVPLVGQVSMDMICVDLGPAAKDQPGDEVVLWGPELAVERVAQAAGTIAYELLCRLTRRVKFSQVSEHGQD